MATRVVGLLPRFWPAALSLGWIVLVIAAGQAVMAAIALTTGDGEAAAFAIGAAICTVVGVAVILANKGRPFNFGFRDAAILTVTAWVILPVFAAIPLVLEPVGLSPVDAFFEMVSAVTTTGSTVMTGLDSQPPSVLIWRSTLQWLGGFGIIGLAIVVLPFLRIGGMQLFRLESSDKSDKALPRVRSLVQAVGRIYLVLTALCFAAYLALGMTPFDAFNHALTTIPTGGFSTHDASFGGFDSPALLWAGILFMTAGAVPFLAYLRLVGRGTLRERIEPQVIALVLALAAASLLVALYLRFTGQYDFGTSLTQAAFSVTSIVTTTGYASTDYVSWGGFIPFFFLLLTLLGGCTGSTAGGIKMLRFQILGSVIRQTVGRMIYPHRIQRVRYGRRTVAEDQVLSVAVFVVVYLATIAAAALMLSISGLDIQTAMSGAAQAVGNVGPGIGPIIGPAGNFESLTEFQKLTLTGAMIMGRLEILGVLVLFAPSFYR